MILHIIIPNYNGCRFLPACLTSIYNQTFRDFKITLIDNGSDDGSLAFVHEHFPAVHTITLSNNVGFAEACNLGICSASAPYVMLLNNDTVLEPHCIQNMMHVIRHSANIFSVGANILTMDAPHEIDSTGDYYSIFGYAFCRSQGLAPIRHQTGPVFTNCACAAIYRTALLKKTGLLDRRFFAYLEDVDLGMRARLFGYQNLHCADAIVYHYGSGTTTTSEKYSSFKVYYSARNNILLRAKNLSILQRLLHTPFFMTGVLLKYIYFYHLQLHEEYKHGLIDGFRLSHQFYKTEKISFTSRLKTEFWIWYGSFLYILQYLKRKL